MTLLANPSPTAIEILEHIPPVGDTVRLYFYLQSHEVDTSYIQLLEEICDLSQEELSSWLNLTTRTLRNYRVQHTTLKGNLKEHIVSLLALYKHGSDVFEDKMSFEKWLLTPNLLLDNRSPAGFLDTISGIRFIDNRLTAIEFGENA